MGWQHVCGILKGEGSSEAQERAIWSLSSGTRQKATCLASGELRGEESKASPRRGWVHRIEELGICSHSTRKPLKHLKKIFKKKSFFFLGAK